MFKCIETLPLHLLGALVRNPTLSVTERDLGIMKYVRVLGSKPVAAL